MDLYTVIMNKKSGYSFSFIKVVLSKNFQEYREIKLQIALATEADGYNILSREILNGTFPSDVQSLLLYFLG